MKKAADRVAALYGMDTGDFMTKGRRRQQVETRSLLCYWAVVELGMGITEPERAFGMILSAVGSIRAE